MTVELLPMGPQAVLVDGVGDPAGWALGLRQLGLPGIVDIVPAATTVLVTCVDAVALRAVRSELTEVETVLVGAGERRTLTIPVRYDGADLPAVAEAAGVSVDDVVALHAGAEYRAAFCGFSPGFAYLTGLSPALHLARRATPRTRVPAGSVAIASQYSAVYPRSSPGGWHLLGTTDVVLFDPEGNAVEPALIRPGDIVRFDPC